MSDGPHRSLKMRKGWKRVAEFADKRAFTAEEVTDAAGGAYGDDWRTEVPETVADGICEVFRGQETDILGTDRATRLEELRRLAAGYGLAQTVIDCAIQHANNAESGIEAAVDATADALGIWGARHSRQVEEHYLRESSEHRAGNVRNRIDEAIGSADLKALARRFLKVDGGPMPSAPTKKTGMDEGVRL